MFSNLLVIDIIKYIDFNLYKKITIDELSSVFHYNKDYIMRLFKKEIHMTIIQYINIKRIFNSLSQIRSTDYSILNIALNFGFYSQEYYCEVFHQIIGVSPTDFKLFLNHSNLLKEEDIYVIQDNISNIESIIRRITYYCSNTPPTSTVKVLSIFKK